MPFTRGARGVPTQTPSARDWQPGDRAYIEVEVEVLGQSRTWAVVRPGGDSRVTSVYVGVEHLRPVPAAGEAATEDVVERGRVVARKAVADEFYAMQGGDPGWDGSPEPNAGDDSVGNAVVRALAAANLLASPDAIRQAKAEAWDEGFDRGFYDPLAGDGQSGRDASESAAKNPYADRIGGE